MFNTIDEVYSFLFNQKKLKKRENLNRIKHAIELLNIKIDYKIIHIAGTNGKGSTAFMTKNILKHTGIHVGMFVSPFVVSFNERIQINDRYISNSEIMYYANKLLIFSEEYKREYNDVIPFFELTLLMALMYFEDRKIDVAVIECGLGGILDPTNALKSDLPIITNIGYDHMEQLGSSLSEIALNKLGIYKDNNAILYTTVDDSLMPLFKSKGNCINISKNITDILVDNYTNFKYKGISYKTSLIGVYQAYNACLAIEAALFIKPNLNIEIIKYGLETVRNPGRFEQVRGNIFIDGAHNIDGIKALISTINLKFNGKVKIVFSALHDKAYKEMIGLLDSVTDKYYFTTITDTRATNPDEFKALTNVCSIAILDYKKCLKAAEDELLADEVLIVTGSLHFISMVREHFLNK